MGAEYKKGVAFEYGVRAFKRGIDGGVPGNDLEFIHNSGLFFDEKPDEDTAMKYMLEWGEGYRHAEDGGE